MEPIHRAPDPRLWTGSLRDSPRTETIVPTLREVPPRQEARDRKETSEDDDQGDVQPYEVVRLVVRHNDAALARVLLNVHRHRLAVTSPRL